MLSALDSALSYAARGWPVHPLRDNEKLPRLPAWQRQATSDEAAVRQWFQACPRAGVGIATGHGLIVLDVDNKNGHDGAKSLRALIDAHGEWPETFEVETPSGGRHYYFTGPATIRNSAGKLGDGLDVRGAGGYVCAPPTAINGASYRVLNDAEPAGMPAWLQAMAEAPKAIPAGSRNDALFREGAKQRRKGLSKQQIAENLRGIPIEGSLEPGEIEQIAESAARYEPDVTSEAHEPCSHLANAHRLVKHFGDQLLYVRGIGWQTWGPPWKHDDLGALRIAHRLGKLIANEAAEMAPWVAAAPSLDQRKLREAAMARRFKWAGASEAAANIEQSLRTAEPLLACEAKDLDAKPLLLGLPSSVLELDTGINRPHLQADRITKVAGCDFDPNASAPLWDRFLTEIMDNDAELIAYLQTLFGYGLSGERGQHILPIGVGGGANGKSTLLSAVQAVFGEYAGTAPPGLLIQRGGTDHPTGLASLQGLRLVISSETGEAGKLNEELVKSLTGGDRISARRMRMDFYEFDPTHLLFLQTNHRPRVSGTDEGIWRRLRLIPFSITVPQEQRDARLVSKLRAELPGILAWCWRGWLRYQAEGFKTPAAVKVATSEYRDASDQVGAFLADECELLAGIATPAGRLFDAYSDWAKASGERPRSQREFGMRLAERGFEQGRTGGTRFWRGIRLVSDACDGSDGGFGLAHTRRPFSTAHTETSVTSVTSVTNLRSSVKQFNADKCNA